MAFEFKKRNRFKCRTAVAVCMCACVCRLCPNLLLAISLFWPAYVDTNRFIHDPRLSPPPAHSNRRSSLSSFVDCARAQLSSCATATATTTATASATFADSSCSFNSFLPSSCSSSSSSTARPYVLLPGLSFFLR